MKGKIKYFILILIIIPIMIIMMNKSAVHLKQDTFVYEYGLSPSKKVEDYIDLTMKSSQQKVMIVENSQLFMNIPNELGHDYPAIGQYDVYITYRDTKLSFQIVVKDTTPPVLKSCPKEIETKVGQKINDIENIKVQDLSSTTIACDDHQVDYHQVGLYDAIVKVSDVSHNTVTQKIKVRVSENQDTDYVRIKDYIPSLYIDLKYATKDNFTGQVIYDFDDAYLRYGTVKKLKQVQDELLKQGYSLKIWDAYRPFDAQKKLWEVVNDSRYVANPAKGPRSHNLGGTVDITLVLQDGTDVEMPTEFDDFSAKADRHYEEINVEAVKNVQILEKTMYKYGFIGYKNEWWDYSDTSHYSFEDFQPQ